MEETTLGADIAAAMGDTSTQPAVDTSVATVDTSAQPGAATTEPAAESTIPNADSSQGPIPFLAHKTALENARTKAVEDWKGKYGWAEQVNPQEFQQLQQIAKHFQGGDPITGLQNLIAEIRKDPQHDAALRSLAAREMGRRTQAPQSQTKPLPVFQLEDGSTVDLNALKAEWQQEVEQKFTPFTQTVEQLQTERKAAADAQQAHQYFTTTYADVQTWPGMQDLANQKAVGEELKQYVIRDDDPREIALALNAAYRKVVLPKLGQASRQAAFNDIHQKAQANTVSPTASSAGTPQDFTKMSMTELFKHEMAARR